jgi:hypothetical protein
MAAPTTGPNLVGMRPVTHEVPAAEHALDAELLDPREGCSERREVAVDVGDDGDGVRTAVHGTHPYIDRHDCY